LFDEKVPISSKRFDSVADIAIDEMERQLAAGVGKSVYNDYITAINKYLIPYFGKYNINTIGYEELQAFGTYRENEMGRKPVASTVTTHISAMNRVYDVAIERGWIAHQQVPKIKNTGAKGVAREAFSKSEYNSLTSYMVKWSENGLTDRATQIRTLLRDYVLILANTGMRHGTEALGLKWNDIAYITIKNQKFLQLTVTGKRGRPAKK
jgi:integrase